MRRFLALLLSFVMVFSVVAGTGLTVAAEPTPTSTYGDNAMHFIIYHWHAVDTVGNPSSNYIVIDGYIQLNGNVNYKIYDQDEKEVSQNDYSKYVKSSGGGSITLQANPYKTGDKTLEGFVGFALSAGQEAITYAGDDEKDITITYDPYIHLVKAHAYYRNEAVMVFGTAQDTVVGGSLGFTDRQIDTAKAYIDQNGIISLTGGGELTKVYNTQVGLHTDKTASKFGVDGRTFNLDLEAWYVDQRKVKVGMVLDASGSMAWTSEQLEPIHREISEWKALGITPLETTINGGPDEWSTYFLTDDQVNMFLDPHNTDNSRLSTSGYTYYIKDDRDNVKEYVPLGYWEGVQTVVPKDHLIGQYKFDKQGQDYGDDTYKRDWLLNSASKDGRIDASKISVPAEMDGTSVNFANFTIAEDVDMTHGWTSNEGADYIHTELKMAENKGLDLDESSGGILLDVVPENGNFTISFVLRQDKVENTEPSNYAEILYVGAIPDNDVLSVDEKYFRVVRSSNGSRNRLIGSDEKDISIGANRLLDINSVFNDGKDTNVTPHTITIVFSEVADGSGEIKINTYKDGEPAQPDNSTRETLQLSGYNIIIHGIEDSYDGSKIYIDDIDVYDIALGDDQVQTLYSASGGERAVPAYAGGEVIGSVNNYFTDSGWYYVNHMKDWKKHYYNEDLESGKILWGIHQVNGDTKLNELQDEVTGSKYTLASGSSTATRFYVDREGYLRCFSANGTNKDSWRSSRVYIKPDEGDIKAEALQRALSTFVTRLSENSPGSEVSAVRFSTGEYPEEVDFRKLVLLNWTATPSDSMGVLSLKRGNGGTLEGTGNQYNYGLTGDTSTWMGLQAFDTYLAGSDTKDDPNTKKYLIIFTDGKDTDKDKTTGVQDKAPDLVEDLKGKGYSVFTVMLAGGAVDYSTEDSSDYQQARTFLKGLAGNYDSEEDGKQYFFSTKENKDETQYVGNENAVDRLIDIFTNEILDEVTEHLDDYTVQDYIDPRFNLMDANGNLWRLDKGGKITVFDKSGKDITNQFNTAEIELSKDTDVDETARKAELHYDGGNEMYFLKWTGQAIPGVSVGADRLTVWNARVTVQAKDDFIGGNAVLTNGHDDMMNYVYFGGTVDANIQDAPSSSGTGDMYRTEGNAYPSKGFPRVVVNVETPAPAAPKENFIYMGETLDNTLDSVLDAAKNDSTRAKWYWEYLDRFAVNGTDKHADLRNGEEVKLDYFYLPNADKSNSTGTDEHRQDKIGTLIYSWDESDNHTGITKDTISRTATLSVTYEALGVDARKSNNNDDPLIVEGAYKWDRDYKPEEGGLVQGLDRTYASITNIVSGEIALQMVLPKDAVQYLQQHSTEIPDGKIIYQAKLVRSYGSDIQNQEVGTFTAEYTIPGEAPTGDVIVPAKIAYNEDYMTQYGLPIGTYSLVPNNGNSDLFTFTDIIAVQLEESHKDMFATFEKHDDEVGKNLTAFAATYSDTSPMLGTDDLRKTYTDERYALLQVSVKTGTPTPESSPEEDDEPEDGEPVALTGITRTGDDSHPGVWIALLTLSMVGMGTGFYFRKKGFLHNKERHMD